MKMAMNWIQMVKEAWSVSVTPNDFLTWPTLNQLKIRKLTTENNCFFFFFLFVSQSIVSSVQELQQTARN